MLLRETHAPFGELPLRSSSSQDRESRRRLQRVGFHRDADAPDAGWPLDSDAGASSRTSPIRFYRGWHCHARSEFARHNTQGTQRARFTGRRQLTMNFNPLKKTMNHFRNGSRFHRPFSARISVSLCEPLRHDFHRNRRSTLILTHIESKPL